MLEYALSAIRESDQWVTNVRKLTQLRLPSFGPDSRSLARVRENELEFAEWRQHLTVALRQFDLSDTASTKEIEQARQVLRDELEPLRLKLETLTKRSPALESLRVGTTDFGVSAIAALSGYLAGGNLPVALTTAGVAKGLDALVRYVQVYKARKKDRAILDLVVLYAHKR